MDFGFFSFFSKYLFWEKYETFQICHLQCSYGIFKLTWYVESCKLTKLRSRGPYIYDEGVGIRFLKFEMSLFFISLSSKAEKNGGRYKLSKTSRVLLVNDKFFLTHSTLRTYYWYDSETCKLFVSLPVRNNSFMTRQSTFPFSTRAIKGISHQSQ